MGEGILYKDLSYAIVGCAQRVHTELGPGFPEAVYRKALCRELAETRIPFQAEAQFEVAYKRLTCGQFKVDVFVDGKIILELKAVDALCQDHEAQLLAYLKASGAKLGMLLNFGQTRLKVKRLAN